MSDISIHRERGGEAGYSLVEVLISLGLLTGVMVSICSMFVMGSTFIKAGKNLTEATVLAQDIMEDINKQSYTGVYEMLQLTIDPNASSVVSDTRVSGDKADTLWGDSIRSTLHDGYAVLNVVPIGGSSFGTGEAVRVDLELGWTELTRNRKVQFVHLRF